MWYSVRTLLLLIQISSQNLYVEKCLECPGTRGLAQLAQGLSFNLANALTGDGERPANLLQRPLRAVLHTKAHPDDLLFPRTESSQHTRGPLLQVHVHDRLGGRDFGAVFDEVAEVKIPLLANGRLQRDRHP